MGWARNSLEPRPPGCTTIGKRPLDLVKKTPKFLSIGPILEKKRGVSALPQSSITLLRIPVLCGIVGYEKADFFSIIVSLNSQSQSVL